MFRVEYAPQVKQIVSALSIPDGIVTCIHH